MVLCNAFLLLNVFFFGWPFSFSPTLLLLMLHKFICFHCRFCYFCCCWSFPFRSLNRYNRNATTNTTGHIILNEAKGFLFGDQVTYLTVIKKNCIYFIFIDVSLYKRNIFTMGQHFFLVGWFDSSLFHTAIGLLFFSIFFATIISPIKAFNIHSYRWTYVVRYRQKWGNECGWIRQKGFYNHTYIQHTYLILLMAQ